MPRVSTQALATDLDASGRERICAVADCFAVGLEIHHVMPKNVGGVDDVSNLAWLCRQHHGLIERFYFWRRSGLAPEACKEIQVIARGFHRGIIPPLLVSELGAKTKKLWAEVHELPESRNPLWWQAAFAAGLRWCQTQEVLREVAPANAIIEEPWFRTKNSESENFIHVFERQTGTG